MRLCGSKFHFTVHAYRLHAINDPVVQRKAFRMHLDLLCKRGCAVNPGKHMPDQKHDDWLSGLGIDVDQLRQTIAGGGLADPTVDPKLAKKSADAFAKGVAKEGQAFLDSAPVRMIDPTAPLRALTGQGIDALVSRDPSKIDPAKAVMPSSNIGGIEVLAFGIWSRSLGRLLPFGMWNHARRSGRVLRIARRGHRRSDWSRGRKPWRRCSDRRSQRGRYWRAYESQRIGAWSPAVEAGKPATAVCALVAR